MGDIAGRVGALRDDVRRQVDYVDVPVKAPLTKNKAHTLVALTNSSHMRLTGRAEGGGLRRCHPSHRALHRS